MDNWHDSRLGQMQQFKAQEAQRKLAKLAEEEARQQKLQREVEARQRQQAESHPQQKQQAASRQPRVTDKAGYCVACDGLVSFEAPNCPHCGQPDAGKRALEAKGKWIEEEKAVRKKEAIPANIADPIERTIRASIKKPTGKLTEADLERVTKLFLNYNKLTSVKGLKKLTQLQALYLDRNQLTDVKGLEKLNQLKELHLNNNPDLTKAQIAELQKALPKCKIYSNPTK